jgi:arsenate reductase
MSTPDTQAVTIFTTRNAAPRNVLALIRNSGVEPRVVEYSKNAAHVTSWSGWITAMGLPVDVLRQKAHHDELGLGDSVGDDALIDACWLHHF